MRRLSLAFVLVLAAGSAAGCVEAVSAAFGPADCRSEGGHLTDMAHTIVNDRNNPTALQSDLATETTQLANAEKNTAGTRLVNSVQRISNDVGQISSDVTAGRTPSTAEVGTTLQDSLAFTALCATGLG
jgi:hypothetical protein